MTNKELFKLWEEFRAEQYHCYPDENGNYPCDNGYPCDRCNDDATWGNFKKYLEGKPKSR